MSYHLTSQKHDAWPYPVLLRTHEPGQRPTRERVLETIAQVNANAASVTTSTLGAPGFGLLGLTLSAAEYQGLTGQAWIRPDQPDQAPNVAHDATQFQIAEANRQHRVEWEQYNLMLHTDNTLRNQLLSASDDVYYRALYQPILGYGRRTTRNLIEHLLTNYAPFDEQTRANVEQAMITPWSGGPFETVIAQIEQACQAYTQAGEAAPTDQFKCDKLYTIVRTSGLLPSACQKWRMYPPAEKTWENCKTLFQKYADDRAHDATAKNQGYNNPGGNANFMELNPTEAMNEATLALIASTQNLANMAKASQESNQQIMQLQADLAACKAQLKVFADMGNSGKRNPRKDRTGNRTEKPHYCWSHGHGNHPSAECKNPHAGHKKEATATNPMGGKHHKRD